MSRTGAFAASSFCISLSVIAFEILLHRSLAVTSYHYFGYFVVTTAMLGFGLSGTMLHLLDARAGPNPEMWLFGCCAACAFSMVACYAAALKIPLDFRYLLYEPSMLAGLMLYLLLLTTPFFFGACALAMVLRYGEKRGILYAANLAGSGVGGIAAVVSASAVPAVYAPCIFAAAAACGALAVIPVMGVRGAAKRELSTGERDPGKKRAGKSTGPAPNARTARPGFSYQGAGRSG